MLNNAKLSIVVEDDTKAACLLTSGVSEFAVLDNDCYTGRLEDGYQARISVYMTDRSSCYRFIFVAFSPLCDSKRLIVQYKL